MALALVLAAIDAGLETAELPRRSAMSVCTAVALEPIEVVELAAPGEAARRRRLLGRVANRPRSCLAVAVAVDVDDGEEQATLTLGSVHANRLEVAEGADGPSDRLGARPC